MAICKQCGKEFERGKGIGNNARKYCSDKCRRKYWRDSDNRVKYHIPKTCTCAWCGIVFEAEQKRSYCCYECRIASYRGKSLRKSNAEKIAKINQLARDEGLSYGQYVAKYGL